MSKAKKRKSTSTKKKTSEVVVVFKSTLPPGKSLAPAKLEKANDMLRRTKFLDEK